MDGYCNQLLKVDLTEMTIRNEPFDVYKDGVDLFLGGSGLASWILYKYLDKELDPYSQDAPLLILTGPLVGSSSPGSGRYIIAGKSPLTGIWGESNSGGNFGPYLKFAGYDGIFITGEAENPVSLIINEGETSLRSSIDIWGKGVYRTQSVLKKEIGERMTSVTCIGKAGENKVKYAALVNDWGRAAGRCGLGAVLGTKKLKAIAVHGSQKSYVSDSDQMNKVVKKAVTEIKEDVAYQLFHDLGTANAIDVSSSVFGSMTGRYFSEEFNGFNISGSTMEETILTGRSHCYACTIGCGRKVKVEGKYSFPTDEGPELETIGAFGACLGNENLESIAYANYLCNDLGLDTISTGVSIGCLFFLAQKDLIPKEIIERLAKKPEWGAIDLALDLVKNIASREGIGDLLAEGTAEICRKFNAEEYRCDIKGLEPPFWDSRGFSGMAAALATSPRGGCHQKGGDFYMVEMGTERPEWDAISSDRFMNEGKGKAVAGYQDLRALYENLIMCNFHSPLSETLCELLEAATGKNYTLEDLRLIGRRSVTMKRLINLKMGLKPETDTLPKHSLQKLTGPTEEHIPDVKLQIKEYYESQDWDLTTGHPTKKQLEKLGLSSLLS